MSSFKTKMHQIRFRLGRSWDSAPDHAGELTAFPQLDFRGPICKGKEEKRGKRKGGRKTVIKGRGRGRRGKGKGEGGEERRCAVGIFNYFRLLRNELKENELNCLPVR